MSRVTLPAILGAVNPREFERLLDLIRQISFCPQCSGAPNLCDSCESRVEVWMRGYDSRLDAKREPGS